MRDGQGAFTHKRQFGYHDGQYGEEINDKIRQVIMRVVRAQQEEQNRNDQQELLRGCILISVVDLLPHVEVVVGASVELKGDSADPVEH